MPTFVFVHFWMTHVYWQLVKVNKKLQHTVNKLQMHVLNADALDLMKMHANQY